jgi:transposase
MEEVYCGIDLHSNNMVLGIKDAEGKVLYRRRHSNDLAHALNALSPYRGRVAGVAVESTFNWYWLVDGLMEHGYPARLVNTTAVQQYDGLKHGDDDSDALHLAELMRLKILPEGYIYPKEERPVRDLLRKRSHLVRQRTMNLLSIQNIVRRSANTRLDGDSIKQLEVDQLTGALGLDSDVARAAEASLVVMRCLQGQIADLEKIVLERVKLRREFRNVLSVPGIGDILGLTIMLEAGEIGRFASVGDFASYCRAVDAKRLSNGKKKGGGNAKNGNKYLAWAFIEAANHAVRCCKPIGAWYQRKKARTKTVVAIKAVAHKLARATYYILRDQATFKVDRAFS